MDLTTTWLGLRLSSPLLPGASPLSASLDSVRRLEDAGAPAIVLHSLFEEQILAEQGGRERNVDAHTHSFPEATSFFPDPGGYLLGPDAYLEHVRRVKEAVAVPVIASLNGTTPEGWTAWATRIEEAGADALELNVYHVATSAEEASVEIEWRLLSTLRAVRAHVGIPIAVKLSPFFSSLPWLAKHIQSAGANGLVLFNRFYQPDIDIESLQATQTLHLSDGSELLLRLRWLAILHGRSPLDLACSGGVHRAEDAVKAIMAGAGSVQMVSALLQHGPAHLATVRADLERWLVEHEYASVAQARGSMSLLRCPDPAAFERGNYMKILQTWGRG